MKQPVIHNTWTKQFVRSIGEKNTLPSLTVPNQSMTVYEIMQRYAAGLPIDGQKVPVYNGDEYLPDLSRLDLVDRHELLDNAAQETAALQKKYAREQADKKAAKQRAHQNELSKRSVDDSSGVRKPAAASDKSDVKKSD